MSGRFSRSWRLTKQSFAVLSKNPVLMAFPCFSALATLLVIASFIIPLFNNGALQAISQHRGQANPAAFLIMFAFYFSCYFVQTFFNCALMASANMVLCGGRTTVRDGLGLAASRIGPIAAWALLAATVGMVLRTLQERVGLIGKIVIALMGTAWTILTYFIGPVLMFENQGLFEGVQRSGQLVKKTWGETVATGVTFFALNLVAAAVWIVSSVALVILNPIAGLLWMIGFLAMWAIVVATADGIFRVALYRYTWIGAKTEMFDQNLIENAFVQQKPKSFGF